MQNAFDAEVRERSRVIPTADRPSGCVGHCATLFWQMAHTRSSSEDREDAETSCVQRSIAPQLHALAGCGCRCATLQVDTQLVVADSTAHCLASQADRKRYFLYVWPTFFVSSLCDLFRFVRPNMLYHGRYGPASRSTEIWTFLEDDVRCAAWFNIGYTLTRQSTFPPAVNCSALAPRSSGKFGCLGR